MEKSGAQEDKVGLKAVLGEDSYPVRFSVEYPESRNRLTVLVRPIPAVPIVVVMQLVTGDVSIFDPFSVDLGQPEISWKPLLPFAAMLWIAPILMIVFRRKYPRWCFDTYLELNRFTTRVAVYLLLLRDEYPSLDEEQAVSLRIEYPDAKSQLNRFLPIVKWLLATPHLIVLAMLAIAAVIVTIIAWFAILIVGRYPRGLFTFVEGSIRWFYRVWCYAFMLTTDRYPPFRLSP